MSSAQPQASPEAPPSSPADQSARDIHRRTLESRRDNMLAHLASLRRDQRRIPWLLVLLLAAIPAAMKWGFTGAALVVIATIFFIGSGFYLINGHRVEYEQKLSDIERELMRL